MGNNLATKVAIIVAVLLVFVYGIIGIPHSTGKGLGDSLKQALADRIHLGLDLKGGTHLVLAVHVAEAVVSSTDRDVARLESELQTGGLATATVSKPDPAHPETIVIAGVTAAQSGQVRAITDSSEYSTYDVASQPDGSMKMTLKPASVKDIQSNALTTSIEVIRQRIDTLGVSEPTIQQYGLGDNQILIELPGFSDPGQVEAAISSTSKLAIHAVVGGPYESDQAALAANSGVIPSDSELFHGAATPASPDQVWLLKRASEVEGTDFRGAEPGTDLNGRPNIRFTLTTEAGERFYKYNLRAPAFGCRSGFDGDRAGQHGEGSRGH